MTTRFAPSPTGLLHTGHAYAAWFAWRAAREANGTFLLRIEDIDPGRCREEYVAAIERDLVWLGIRWDQPPVRQSERLSVYREALDRLHGMGVLYPCFCTRREIMAAGAAPHGPQAVYPGTCRQLDPADRRERIAAGHPYALRLDAAHAAKITGPLTWHDRRYGTISVSPDVCGDVVLARKDAPVSYHLAVTVDDAAQGVTLVTRGEDLLHATHVHRTLQALLDLDVPEWHHHRLLTDTAGRRLSKRDRSLTLAALREAGRRPEDILAPWREDRDSRP